jgi:hypothetical protein
LRRVENEVERMNEGAQVLKAEEKMPMHRGVVVAAQICGDKW